MSIERGPSADARDAGVARIRTLTRVAVVGAAVLSGAVGWVAAASTHVRKATHAATQSARRTVTVPAAVPAPAPSSVQAPAPVAPAQAPAQSMAPPVVSSSGS